MKSDNTSPFPDNAISYRNNNLYLEETSPGIRGVFSLSKFKTGEIIECCPLILFSEKEVGFLKYTNLYNYYSSAKNDAAPGFLALGFGAIYNHCLPANAEYSVDISKQTLTITAVSPIEANMEITINYNGRFDDETPVLFTTKDEVYEFSVTLF